MTETPSSLPAEADHPTGYGFFPDQGTVWEALVRHLDDSLERLGQRAGRVIVLLPYVQLVEPARRAWARRHPQGFGPRFETTRTWAAALAPWSPSATDVSGDLARDSLVAEAMVLRVARGQADPGLRSVLVSRLVEATRSLLPVAAARSPSERSGWVRQLQEPLSLGPHWESLLATLALAWAGQASQATDVLWGPAAAPGVAADRLCICQGFQHDALGDALAALWGERAEVLELFGMSAPSTPPSATTLQSCADGEEEAWRATATVIQRVNEGRVPLALVASDRRLVRRVSAMLAGAGVRLSDETGWKLSTTLVAARVMALLRAASPRARTDEVLDLLKAATMWNQDQVDTLEGAAREHGVSAWRGVLRHEAVSALVPSGLVGVLESLQAARPLEQWLDGMRSALQATGLWPSLQSDAAGQKLIRALRLDEGAPQELVHVGEAWSEGGRPGLRMSLSAFETWTKQVLEAASFRPDEEADPQVVILPLAQLPGRAFAGVVMPGCDEVTLDPDAGQKSPWTVAQAALLGLPDRQSLVHAQESAWKMALRLPLVDILWRRQESGEPMAPSPWVTALPDFDEGRAAATTFQIAREMENSLVGRPEPVAPDLLPGAMSASAYQDLRDCPYRFFALRQLRLKEADELETSVDQRDLGNWLHAVLRQFHEERGDVRPGRLVDEQRLDTLGEKVAAAMGLQVEDGAAGFLPFLAVWPAMRNGYLDWLVQHEGGEGGTGPRFVQAEAELRADLPPWRLYGKLDRIDQQSSPEGLLPLVIDYKTESREKTRRRVREPLEDTQLAFYAALLPDENLRAAYLSITDGRSATASEGATTLIEQPLVLQARDHLRAGLQQDLGRVASGHGLPALGEGSVCEHCAARGLCRRDFWSAP